MVQTRRFLFSSLCAVRGRGCLQPGWAGRAGADTSPRAEPAPWGSSCPGPAAHRAREGQLGGEKGV